MFGACIAQKVLFEVNLDVCYRLFMSELRAIFAQIPCIHDWSSGGARCVVVCFVTGPKLIAIDSFGFFVFLEVRWIYNISSHKHT